MIHRQNRQRRPWLTSCVPKVADLVPIPRSPVPHRCSISGGRAPRSLASFPRGYRATLEGICKAQCRSATILLRPAAGRPQGDRRSSSAPLERAASPICGLLAASARQMMPTDSGVIVIVPRCRDEDERWSSRRFTPSALVLQRKALPPAGVRLSGRTRSIRPRDPGSPGRIFFRPDESRIRPGVDTQRLARRVDRAGLRIGTG